ncbi:hypothetical protein B296_00050431 [Ensete ventricosum]|uniref:Uncharacterized protein n=1 Tax=Ensete ventricosum TaxID=4639 RepID=A0A426XY30_ENSVE|nr:hypothetical protein B296_00050431 [Ensete ventricosum]
MWAAKRGPTCPLPYADSDCGLRKAATPPFWVRWWVAPLHAANVAAPPDATQRIAGATRRARALRGTQWAASGKRTIRVLAK